jgi:hypothetical protein
MVYWIRKFGKILGLTAFFILFFIGMASSGQVTWGTLLPACARALGGAVLFWIVGIVVADILVKGIITDIDIDRKGLVEGGLLQQVHSIRRKSVPGGPEMPFERPPRRPGK